MLFALTAALAMAGALWTWLARGEARRLQTAAETTRTRQAQLLAESLRLAAAPLTTDASTSDARDSSAPTRNRGTSVVEAALVLPRDDPTLLAHGLEVVRSELPFKYRSFYRARGLTADQVAKFEASLLEHEGRKRDIRATERGRPIDRAHAETREATTIDGRRVHVLVDASIAALSREEEARFKAEQIALLGADGHAALQEFEPHGESRKFVDELVADLALTPTPLNAEQYRELERLLRGIKARSPASAIQPDWRSATTSARALLLPPQFAAWEAAVARSGHHAARHELTRLVRQARKRQ